MPTANQYLNKTINCEGGLDLVTPKLLTAPGSLTDCLNFEVGVRSGYTRIDGYERFDGAAQPSLAYNEMSAMGLLTITFPATSAGAVVYDSTGTYVLGFYTSTISVSTGAGVTYIAVAVADYERYTKSVSDGQVKINGVSYNVSTISGAIHKVSSVTNITQEIAWLQSQYDNLRGSVGYLPCGNWYRQQSASTKAPAIGLQLFKDTVYAIQDLNILYFDTGNSEVFPGDTIKSASAEQLTVRQVTVDSGTWGAGNAKGHILVGPGTFATGLVDIVRPTATVTAALKVISNPVATFDAEQAGLFKSSSTSWQFVETGYNFTYDSGAKKPNKLDRGEVTQTNLLESDTGKLAPGSTSNDSGWSIAPGGNPNPTTTHKYEAVADYQDASEPHNDAYDAYLVSTDFGSNAGIRTITLGTYTTNIPSDATVTGIEVGIRGGVTLNFANVTSQAAFDAALFSLVAKPNITGYTTSEKSVSAQFNYSGEYVIGGDGEMFDLTSTDPASLSGMTFDISVRKASAVTVVANDGVTTNTQTPYLDYVYIKVYWTQKVSEYYFYDPVGHDEVKAQIVDYWVTDGDWNAGTAKGTMQIYSSTTPSSVDPVGSANRRTIKTGDEIRSASGGGGVLIGKVTSNMVYSGLAPLAQLEANSSRYQMIVANFYGNKDWEAIYGCSGAGRAFAYDGYYLRYIYTGLEDSLDKPRHVAFHQHSLALGFNSGNLSLSVIGEPTNYSGLDGAVAFDLGDQITGLVRMNGTTLGCFCSKSIHGLVGSSVNDYSVMILSPYEGAIEYTVLDMGKPVYCSPRGISVFEQTNAYGDFLGNRLSTLVTPWLLPRLQKQSPPIDSSSELDLAITLSRNPVVAIPVRSKNQYQLWFADGYRLTMTLVGLDLKPAFTIQQIWSYTNNKAHIGSFIPRAECSANYSNGQEMIVMSKAFNNALQVGTIGNELAYVYAMEKGWTFDGVGIWGYVDINDNFLASEYENDVIRKERVYGLSHGYFPLKSLVANDYNTLDLTTTSVSNASPVSLPREDLQPTHVYPELLPVTNICNTAKEGRSFSIKYYIPNDTDTMGSVEALNVAPPGVIQALLIQHINTKADV